MWLFETLFIHVVEDGACSKSFQTKQMSDKWKKSGNTDSLHFYTSLPHFCVSNGDTQHIRGEVFRYRVIGTIYLLLAETCGLEIQAVTLGWLI